MPTTKATDPYKRHKTRHRGITYRVRRDGSRTYAVYSKGAYIAVEGGEQEAVALQADLRAKRARGEHVPKPSKATFAEVAEQWFESKHKLRAWTRKNYRASLDRILLPRFGSMQIAAITVDDVAALIRDLDRQGLATAYIENHLKPLNGTMRYAVRRRMIATNPCSLLTSDDRPERRARKLDHVWSDEEVEALIEAAEQIAKQPTSRFNYAPLLRVAIFTGLRLGELLGLRWADLDLHEGVLRVERQYTRLGEFGPPKTEQAIRRVPLSPDMVRFLREYRIQSRNSQDDDPVFACRSGKPLGHRNATRRGFEAAAAKAGIEGVTFHDLRHAFASRLIARGIDPVTLAKLMGHKDARVTLSRYAHEYDRQRTDEQVRQAMSAEGS